MRKAFLEPQRWLLGLGYNILLGTMVALRAQTTGAIEEAQRLFFATYGSPVQSRGAD